MLRRFALVALLTAACALAAAPGAAARVPLRGVGVHSLWAQFSDADMDRDLALAQAAGSTVVRVDVAWASLEVKGKRQISDWYLRRIDRFVAGANSRGMKVLMTLWASPCWASSAPDNVKAGCGQDWNQGSVVYPPSNPADFGDIAGWLTARYGSKIAALELWNEPNLTVDMFWKADDKAAAYARLVRGAYLRAKLTGNPAVPLVMGGLVRPDIAFLQALYADGVRGFYDGVSVHPYGVELSAAKLNAFHAAQRSAGDLTPMWITEFGAPTGDGGGWHVTESEQAANITRYWSILDGLSYVQGATLYNLRDNSTDKSDFIANFGVVHFDYSPKPALAALQAALKGRPSSKAACKKVKRSKRSARSRKTKAAAKGCVVPKRRKTRKTRRK